MANPVLLTPEVASAGVSALGSIGNTFCLVICLVVLICNHK